MSACPLALPTGSPGPAIVLHVPILMYHRVVPYAEAGDSLRSLVVPPELFAAQLDAIHGAGWHTITVAALAADLAAGRRPARRTLAVTFDDGHVDGFTYALPILVRHDDVATFYVVTGRIGEPDNLTADQVQALAAMGMEIGDHTVGHRDLAALPPDELRFQVEDAAARIATLTGTRPSTFAYPYGECDPAVVREVQSAGFALAVTNLEGIQESWPGRFIVPRLRVGPGTSPELLLSKLAPYG